METMTRVRAVPTGSVVPVFQGIGGSSDFYIPIGRIGAVNLNAGCYTWGEILNLAAAELWRTGEADAARVTLKAGRQTVRAFLRQRFGVVTGARQFFTPSHRKPDEQDAREFLSVLGVARRQHANRITPESPSALWLQCR
jgi:hypothetical protein